MIHDGKPDLFLIQRRSMMSNSVKIQLEAQRHPACFTAFDILYYEDHPVTDLPLTERKKLLESVIKEESPRFAVSRWIEGQGIAYYELAKSQNLEGIVAKRKDSRYYCDKRTKDWIKCKFLKDSDYVVCGYIPKENHMTSLVLGQYREGRLVYKGHVTLGVGGEAFQKICAVPTLQEPPMDVPKENENAIWVRPNLVCTVKYMMKTESGSLRQPVFKGLREDKRPEECEED